MGDASPKHKIITAPLLQPTQMGLSMKYVHVKIILCLWFRASLIYINNRPTRCNTKQSIYYSASFGCQPHPSLGVHKPVTTASGTVQLPPSDVAKVALPRWREVATQKI